MAKKQIRKYVFEPGISKDSNLYPKAVALLTANKAFLQAQVVAFINYNITNSVAPYIGYTYESSKCTRDVGFFIDAIIHDLRYGGNVKCRQVADYFWIEGEPMIRGDVSPEITGQAYLRDTINNFIFANATVAPSYGQTSVTQVKIAGQNAETGASSRNTSLWSVFSTVISDGIPAMPAKVTGVSSIRLLGKIEPSELLLITETATNEILYNFADATTGITVEYKNGRSSGDGNLLSDLDYPTWWQTTDTITTVYLSKDTSGITDINNLQIFVEEPYQTIRPWEFGTDAIERMRVAAPQAMLDADFEYGLQPTKWQALGLIRNYPSLYEIPGTDLSVSAVTTDASTATGGFGSSLITVTTSGSHGFSAGQAITIKGLNPSVAGFSRAEGSFLVYSVPSSVSFTYYSSSKVGTSNNENLYTTYIQIRQAGFYTGSSIGAPTFSVFSNGTSITINSKFLTPSGSFTLAFDGTSPTTGSPISGTGSIPLGTSVSGVVGAGTVVANIRDSVTSPSATSITLTDLSGIQEDMALDNGAGVARFITSLAGSTLNLSGAIGQTFVGSSATVAGISGTNISSIGSGAVFEVSRAAGIYTVTGSVDSTSNGINYAVGDQILIGGNVLGGSLGPNDLVITVTEIDSGGAINNFSYAGEAIDGGATYTLVTASSTTSSTGTGALITVQRTGGTGEYVISLVDGGTGYAPADTVTWNGSLFGGADGVNDIVIEVSGVAFGTNAIVDYTVVGTPIGITGNGSYTGVSGTNVTVGGAGAVFSVSRSNGLYTTAVASTAGSGYVVGNRIQVLGTSLNGTAPLNNCLITVEVVNISGGVVSASVTGTAYAGDTISIYPSVTLSEALTGDLADNVTLNVGAIATIQVDFANNHGLLPGTTILSNISSLPAPAFSSTERTLPSSGTWSGIAFAGGTFVAIRTGSNVTGVSNSGTIWQAGGNLPSSTTWTSIAAGAVGSTTVFAAIASGGTAAAYSTNAGVSWTSTALPASATWSHVTYYNGFFVAVASGSTAAAYSADGQTWLTATLPSSTTWVDVVGGLIGSSSYFMAIASGGTAAAYSVDNGATWTATAALPTSSSWSGIAFGNSRFVAVASGSTAAAVSTNGTSWTAVTLPTSAAWNHIVFGDDNFVVVASGVTNALTSFTGETGSWTDRTLGGTSAWTGTAYGVVSNTGLFITIGAATSALGTTLTSANHQLGAGPFVVTAVPSLTSIRYPARTTGTINNAVPITGQLYVRPDSFFTHRPFDGGVQLGTGGPSHASQAIRQSKKYVRYQSGKGIMYTTGGLFAPSYNLSLAVADGLAVNSLITFTTDDTDHGLQPGAEIEIIGLVSFEYNGDYIVDSIVDARRFRVRSKAVLSSSTGTLGPDCKVILKRWHGSTVRIGAFDEQNGIFYQYNGTEMSVVRRSSTNQLTGTVSVATESNQLTGTTTRFQDQLKVGDKIVLRGMSHTVTAITSQTSLTMCPDWRGANAITGAKICLTEDLVIPQSEWNLDPIDGTGPSGYNMLPWRMQMLGIQYSWYAAGFIEFMLRGADGKFVFLHRIRNSNVNTEAYMRTANLPVRYEVENTSARSKLREAITSGSTTIELTDGYDFPPSGIVYIDNELISYSGKSGNTLSGLSRNAVLNNFSAGQNRTFTGGLPADHAINAGVILISCTCTPTISHWGSALLTDGLFDEDRGYLFNYAATGLSITTAKQTAFMIRLAPSVSNALTGDLGERDLLNRAQLLLNEIAVTSDTGTGAIVVEGVLNPRNYPTDPTRITWTGLAGSGAGGQPSFAQIALGGSINWGGVPATTTTATVQGALSTTITARGFNPTTTTITGVANPSGLSGYTTAVNNTRTDFIITNTQFDTTTTTPLRVGDRLTATFTNPSPPFNTVTALSGQTISSIERSYLGSSNTRIVMTAVANNTSPVGSNLAITVTSVISTAYASAISVGRNDFLILDSSPVAASAQVGDTLNTATFIIANQTITAITPSFARVNGINYTRITMSSSANNTSAAGAGTTPAVTVTAAGTAASYTNSNFLFFTNASWNASGAAVGTRVAVSFTQFPAGTSIAAVTSRLLGGVTIQRVTFTQTSSATIASAAAVTFQFGDPQFALPGEQVFSFVTNPGQVTSLNLDKLKELTTTAIGGRGAFPNGPDVLAINIFKVTGTPAPGSIILRWGEAQA